MRRERRAFLLQNYYPTLVSVQSIAVKILSRNGGTLVFNEVL